MPLLNTQHAHAQGESPCDAVVTGQILDEDTNQTVPDAQVVLSLDWLDEVVFTVTTDKEGRYRVDSVCPGVYGVEISASGLESLYEELEVTGDVEHDWLMVEIPTVLVEEDVYNMPNVRTIERLDGRELDKTRGLALGDSLEAVNGVRTIDTGTISKPVIHGMYGNRIRILFDGVHHESQSWGLDHAPEIDPFAAQSLSVVKGAAGVRYGSGAIGGVVLVDPAPIPRDPGVSGEAYAVGVSNSLGGAGSLMLRGSSEWIDGLGWRVQGSVRRAGSLESPDYVLDNTSVEELNASGAIRFVQPRYGVTLSASRFYTRLGVFTGLVAENSNQFKELIEQDLPLNVDLYEFDYEFDRPFQEVTHTTVKGETFVAFEQAGRLTLEVSHQNNRRLEFDKVRNNIEGPQLDFELRTTGGQLLYEFDVMGHVFNGVGVDFAQQENVFVGRRLIPNYRSNQAGVFGWTQLVYDQWEGEVGARVDIDRVDTYQRERVGGQSAPIEENNLQFVTPSAVVGVLWRPDETFKLKTTLSSASRAPTINELFIDGVSQGLAALEQGDVDLDPEQTYAFNVDLSWAPTHWFETHITGYTQFIDGYIFLAPELDENGDPRVALTINGGFPAFEWLQVDALFYGVDADASIKPTSWLEFRTQAAIVRAEDVQNDAFLPFIPPDFFKQELRLKAASLGPLKDNYLSATSAFTARQRRADVNTDFTEAPDGYHLLGAGVGTAWSWGPDFHMQLDLEANNLLNTSYRSYLSRQRYFADEPGRTFIARLKAVF